MGIETVAVGVDCYSVNTAGRALPLRMTFTAIANCALKKAPSGAFLYKPFNKLSDLSLVFLFAFLVAHGVVCAPDYKHILIIG